MGFFTLYFKTFEKNHVLYNLTILALKMELTNPILFTTIILTTEFNNYINKYFKKSLFILSILSWIYLRILLPSIELLKIYLNINKTIFFHTLYGRVFLQLINIIYYLQIHWLYILIKKAKTN